jgi:cysteine desulfurase
MPEYRAVEMPSFFAAARSFCLNGLWTTRSSRALPAQIALARLRDSLAGRLLAAIPHAYINGSREHRLPGNLSLTVPGIDATDLIDALPDLAISAGSACTSGQGEPSHVLTAIGRDRGDARATIRLGLGRYTRHSDIEYATHRIGTAVARLHHHLNTRAA